MTATGKIPTPRRFGKTCAITWQIAPGYAKGHRLVMSHYPMLSWNGKARGAIMLHGHIHSRGDRTNARNRDRERPSFATMLASTPTTTSP